MSMSLCLSALCGGARAELLHLCRSKFLVALTIAQAVTFLVLVSLFGITGARAPTAVIDNDHGPLVGIFVAFLKSAHNSFDIRMMDEPSATKQIEHGNLVAMIVIPKGFSEKISHRENATIKLVVDNINTDMTEDIQRALPSAILSFGQALWLPRVHVHVDEADVIPHDTDFIPYLVVSSLVSAALIIAGILSAIAVAREYESGTIQVLRLAPIRVLIPLLGRVLASSLVATLALVITVAIVIFGYGIKPAHPVEMAAGLALCILTFSCAGLLFGTVVRRTLPVASIIFGMALPLFLVSGSYEPERFDGNLIWGIAHLSPVYYGVGIVEHAALGLQVTPESVAFNFVALIGWIILYIVLSVISVRRAGSRC